MTESGKVTITSDDRHRLGVLGGLAALNGHRLQIPLPNSGFEAVAHAGFG